MVNVPDNIMQTLTPEQEEKIPAYRDWALKTARSTERANRKKVVELARKVYKASGYDFPEDAVYWANSPKEAIEIALEIGAEQNAQDALYHMVYGFQDSYWLSFYKFLDEEVGLKEIDDALPLVEMAEQVGWWAPYDEAVIFQEKPVEIHVDENNNLHNTEGMAVKYADGFGMYSLDGIRIPSKEMHDLQRLKEKPEEVLKIENAEHRLVIMKYFGVENMLPALNAKSVHKNDNGYELLEVTIEGSPEKLLKMQNPSESHKQHYEFVEPHVETCEQAMANRVGLEVFTNPTFQA